MNASRRRLSRVCLAALLFAGCVAHGAARGAMDIYGDLGCEDSAARLDNFAIALSSLPAARGHLIVYGGRLTPPRRVRDHVAFIKYHLTEVRGVAASRYDVVDGGRRDRFSVWIFIVPEGDQPPSPLPGLAEEDQRAASEASKFDEGFVALRRSRGGRVELVSEGVCPLDTVDLGEYARALRAEPDAGAHVVVYGARGARLSEANTVSRLIRHRLFTVENIAHRRISVAYGGTREEPSVELWLVPRGASPPPARRR